MILAQDTVALMENLDERVGQAFFWDMRQLFASYDRLEVLRRERGALLIPGHDPDTWALLRHAPAFYA